MEVQLHKDAVFVHPCSVDFTLHLMVNDKDGNTVQLLPLTCQGICYPHGERVQATINELVKALQAKLDERNPNA